MKALVELPPESLPAARPLPGNVTEVVTAWAGARWPESNVPGSLGCDVLSQDSPGPVMLVPLSARLISFLPGPLLNPLIVFCPTESELKQWLYHLEKQIQLNGGSLGLPFLSQVSVLGW